LVNYFYDSNHVISIRFLMLKLLLVLHWIGFLMTLAMSVLSFMDQSKDEYMIHIIASSMPLLFTWLLRKAMAGPCRLFPFLKE